MIVDPSFEMRKAIEYIESLAGVGPILATPQPLLRLQPSVGSIAARLLESLILAARATRVLEIGTSIGYAAVAMGNAARRIGGSVLTVEKNPAIAAVARANIDAAGLGEVVDLRVEDANALLPDLAGPFGLILQDGAKVDYLPMLPRLVDLLPPGGVLVSDDVLFPVMDLPESVRAWQEAIGEYNAALRARPDLHTVWLPVGDGIAVSVKVR